MKQHEWCVSTKRPHEGLLHETGEDVPRRPPGVGTALSDGYVKVIAAPCYGAAIHALGARAKRSRRVRHGLKVSR